MKRAGGRKGGKIKSSSQPETRPGTWRIELGSELMERVRKCADKEGITPRDFVYLAMAQKISGLAEVTDRAWLSPAGRRVWDRQFAGKGGAR